jgi:endonuclease G
MKLLHFGLIIFGFIILSINSGFVSRKPKTNNLFYHNSNDTLFINKNASLPLEFPNYQDSNQVVRHLGYSLEYNEACEQAVWVAYSLTKQETSGVIERGDIFSVDPKVKTGTANKADYLKSGFDRGHLAPAADMKWSEQAMDESFYFSNMSPQLPAFNRGVWKRLEDKMRDWAIIYDSILIVTGPVLNSSLTKIGPNEVCVPTHYYKVILDFKKPQSKGIGFILPNSGSKEELRNFAVSIDSVEQITGLDFFFQLNDSFEMQLEKQVCLDCWEW